MRSFLQAAINAKGDKREADGTHPLLLGEAHDLHGLQGLLKQLVVLLARELYVTRDQETVAVEVLQQQLLYKHKHKCSRRQTLHSSTLPCVVSLPV